MINQDSKNLAPNISRIMSDIEFLAGIKNPNHPNGCTRHSFSSEDMIARDYLLAQMKDLHLTTKIDGVGNIRARYEGTLSDAPPILVGSHIDTVTSGGAYDGVVGVVCALECIRVLKENGVQPKNPIEIIIFSEEEGSNFAGTLLGSKALIGNLSQNDLKNMTNQQGTSAYELIKSVGYDIGTVGRDIIKKDDVKAMLELHIEQGDILDRMGCSLGIVKAIAGQHTYKVKLTGVSNHAGSTQMISRQDPMVGAAEIFLHMKQAAQNDAGGTAVATVGKISCYPNSTNAIAGEVEFYVDIRDVDEDGLKRICDELDGATELASKNNGLTYSIDLIAKSPIVHLDKDIVQSIKTAASELNIDYKEMNSGAVHDSVMLTKITKVGMIFVPSVKGLSHCPEEFTKSDDILIGCKVLLKTLILLDCI